MRDLKIMSWKTPEDANLDEFNEGEKILHIGMDENGTTVWYPYYCCNQLAVEDYKIKGGSKGLATYHKLRKAGYKLVNY